MRALHRFFLLLLLTGALAACNKGTPEPPQPTAGTSVPDTSSPNTGAPTQNKDLSNQEETREMPLPGQNSDHSVPEDVAPLKSPDKSPADK